jgi:hypothetical protein
VKRGRWPLAVALLSGLSGLSARAQQDIDFGVDSHPQANDRVCNDARFEGTYAQGPSINRYETHRDATDCRALLEAGSIRCKSRSRCAEDSRESQFHSLEVRKSLVGDLSDGLPPEARAMIYGAPEQLTGTVEFTSVDGKPVKRKAIVLLGPGLHRFGISWVRSPMGINLPTVVPPFVMTLTADAELEFELEAGKFYRVNPQMLVVADRSRVTAPVRIGRRRYETPESAATLALWVVDAGTRDIVVDQRN